MEDAFFIYQRFRQFDENVAQRAASKHWIFLRNISVNVVTVPFVYNQ